VEAEKWRTEDDDGRKAVIGRLPLNPLATCCVDGVTRQLTRRRVSCSRTRKRSFRSRS